MLRALVENARCMCCIQFDALHAHHLNNTVAAVCKMDLMLAPDKFKYRALSDRLEDVHVPFRASEINLINGVTCVCVHKMFTFHYFIPLAVSV